MKKKKTLLNKTNGSTKNLFLVSPEEFNFQRWALFCNAIKGIMSFNLNQCNFINTFMIITKIIITRLF
jgi:hypothetical protein